MGAVYRVADLRLPGRLCALKVMRTQVPGLPDTQAVEATRRQFLAEASTLAQLDHPNLPKVSDYFSLDDYDCLVMDYVPGQDLLQRIQEARRQGKFLSLEDTWHWIDQLCDVLGYLHDQQPPIIHGDVKPANIKLTAGGRLKLVDFGLVRPGDPEDLRTLTGAGLRGMGSLPYAALEQYAGSGARVDARTDLYSLGATFYHLVSNQIPAGAHDRFLDPATLILPSQINPALPLDIERSILAAMQPHPKDRPVSVAAWHRLLLAVRHDAPDGRGDSPTAGRRLPTPDNASGKAARRRQVWVENRWYAMAATLLLLAAVVLTFLR
jgi:eukaryotic-like serine/threonine-protein kinase